MYQFPVGLHWLSFLRHEFVATKNATGLLKTQKPEFTFRLSKLILPYPKEAYLPFLDMDLGATCFFKVDMSNLSRNLRC